MLCLFCNKETKNPKFCSKNCSAKYNNRKFQKRFLEGKCKVCNKPIHSTRIYCKSCHDILFEKYIVDEKTLEDVIYKKHHKSSAFALVRSRARKVGKILKWSICQKCGYNKHVEICHIKPISDFSLKSLVNEINDPKNLIALCPNCHWEFDNGLLKV